MAWSSSTLPPRRVALIALRLVAVLAMVLALNYGLGALVHLHLTSIAAVADGGMLTVIMVVLLVCYTLLLAVPFVPGVEVGLALLAIFGASVAPMVYGATVVGLCLAFSLGRSLPASLTVRALRRIGATGLAGEFEVAAALQGRARVEALLARSRGGAVEFVLRHQTAALAIALNMPGSALAGGGGGIAMAAGLSRLYSPARFCLIVALSVAPVPLFMALFGTSPLDLAIEAAPQGARLDAQGGG